jgi:virginiamycin B lyase
MSPPLRRLVSLLLALGAIAFVLAPAAGAAGHPLVRLPGGTEAQALAIGPEGDLWFAGVRRGADAANVVGRISAAGQIVDEASVPNSASTPGVGALVAGPEGDMWFTEPAANRIERVAPGGRPEGFQVPKPGSRPTGIVRLGGSLWATLEGVGAIAEIHPVGEASEFTLTPGWRPTQLALGGDSALWIIGADSSELVRKPPTGRSISFPIPKFAAGAQPSDIVAGPEGSLWMSQSDGPYVSRLETEPVEYTRLKLPLDEGFSLISNGPARDMWFAGGGRIGSVTVDGRLFARPTCALAGCATVTAIAEGPEGGLWFAAGGKVGRFEPPPLAAASSGRLLAKGKKRATTTVICEGGAAGQRCQGKLEMRPAKGSGGRLGSVRFGVVTGTARKVTLNPSRAAAADLARDGRLPVRLVARIGGKVSSARAVVLAAAK